jgi:hypothetical protein
MALGKMRSEGGLWELAGGMNGDGDVATDGVADIGEDGLNEEEEEEEGRVCLVPGPALARFCGTGAQMFKLENLTLGAGMWFGSRARS